MAGYRQVPSTERRVINPTPIREKEVPAALHGKGCLALQISGLLGLILIDPASAQEGLLQQTH